MHNFFARFGVFVLFAFMTDTICAQTTSVSKPLSEQENKPYSKYGIGELWDGNSTAIKSMGSITSTFADPFLINSDNPSSYSSLLLTTFEGGAVASTRSILTASGTTYKTGTATLGYITLGIPFNKKGGLCLGMRPYAKSYYSLLDTLISPAGQVQRTYWGDGGLSYAYMGASYKYKGLSLGFNFGYLFGNYKNFTAAIGTDSLPTNAIYTSIFSRHTSIGGIYWKSGAMYEHKLKDSGMLFRVGGTLTLGQNLHENMSNYRISYRSFADTTVNDTSFASTDVKSTLTLPLSYSIGVMLGKNDKWSFGLDYSGTNWSTFKSTGDAAMNFGIGNSNYKMSLGAQLTPNSQDLFGYFSRVTYRVGAYYGTDYLRLNNLTLPSYGLTFGASFPYKRNVRTPARFHTSFDIGRLGTTQNNLLRQSYVRFGLGFSFNERWFAKRGYE